MKVKDVENSHKIHLNQDHSGCRVVQEEINRTGQSVPSLVTVVVISTCNHVRFTAPQEKTSMDKIFLPKKNDDKTTQQIVTVSGTNFIWWFTF